MYKMENSAQQKTVSNFREEAITRTLKQTLKSSGDEKHRENQREQGVTEIKDKTETKPKLTYRNDEGRVWVVNDRLKYGRVTGGITHKRR